MTNTIQLLELSREVVSRDDPLKPLRDVARNQEPVIITRYEKGCFIVPMAAVVPMSDWNLLQALKANPMLCARLEKELTSPTRPAVDWVAATMSQPSELTADRGRDAHY